MSDCNCCCGAYAPPWWVTMGFVPPTNPAGQTHPATTVPAPTAVTTVRPAAPAAPAQPTQPAKPTGGNSVGSTIGSVIGDVLNPIGALAGLL
jgi:hypothetical protein